MFRASLISFLFSVLLVAKQTSAVEVSSTVPALKPGTTTDNNAAGSIIIIEGTAFTKTGITPGPTTFLIHKNTPDTGIAVTGCTLTATTITAPTPADQMCQCTGAFTATGAGTPPVYTVTSTTLLSAALTATPPGVALTSVNPVYIWQSFCKAQQGAGAPLCQNLANAPNPCYVAPVIVVVNPSSLQPSSGPPSPSPSTNPSVAPGGNVSPAAASGNSTAKAGSSMTTPKIAVMTIVPVALLAVANFVV